MTTVKLIALFLALLLAPPAHAEFVTGERLLRMLSGDEEGRSQALGYVAGVHDALRGSGHCSPTSLNPVALTEEVKVMLPQLGSFLKYSADSLIGEYLKQKWPFEDKSPAVHRTTKPGLTV